MKRFALILFLFAFALPAHAASHAYAATSLDGATAIEVDADATKAVTFTLWNAGTRSWKNTGSASVSLRTSTAKVSASRLVAKLTEASIAPGRKGTFTFRYVAPDTVGTYEYHYQLASGKSWFSGTSVHLTVHVVEPPITKTTSVNASAYVVADALTGEIITEKNADEIRNIASLTKLVTVMTAKRLGAGDGTVVTMERDDEVGGGRLQMPFGSRLTVENLLAAILIGSANNSANALARSVGLPRTDFVARMNDTATLLGLTRSHFVDPSGIEVGNVSTAREFARIARTAFADDQIARLTSTLSYPVIALNRPEVHEIKNTNKLFADTSVRVLAGKTGFINEAGYTLATELRKENRRDLLIVVLGSDTRARSFRAARVLAEQAW